MIESPEKTMEAPQFAEASAGARPESEVVATCKRRQFSSREKRRILDAADRCRQPGDIGALLRKEGIYSSHLSTWRQQRAAAERAALEPQKRGRKADPARAEDRRVAHLTQENDRLRRKLAQARTIINVQKNCVRCSDCRRTRGPDASPRPLGPGGGAGAGLRRPESESGLGLPRGRPPARLDPRRAQAPAARTAGLLGGGASADAG